MIQSIKFTSPFWHSWEKSGSKEDLKTKIEPPPTHTPPSNQSIHWEDPVKHKNKDGPLGSWIAPLFVTLSIFIKGLPLVYPGRGLMPGRGKDHAVTFTVLKKAYCWPLPKVLVLKAFWELFRLGCALQIRGAVKCQVLPIHTFRWWRSWSGFWIGASWPLLRKSGLFTSVGLLPLLSDCTSAPLLRPLPNQDSNLM